MQKKNHEDKLIALAAVRLLCPLDDIVLEHAGSARCGLESFYRALAHNKHRPNTMVYVRFDRDN